MRHLGWQPTGARVQWTSPTKRGYMSVNAVLALLVAAAIYNSSIVGRVAALHDGRGLRAASSKNGCKGGLMQCSMFNCFHLLCSQEVPGIALAMCPSTTFGARNHIEWTATLWK